MYSEYLRDICSCFERAGVNLNLDFESSRFALQRSVKILEDWLYFNDFLKAVNSPHKIRTLYDSSEFSYYRETLDELSGRNSVSLGDFESTHSSLPADPLKENRETIGIVHDVSSFNKMLATEVPEVKNTTNSDVYVLESSISEMGEPSLDVLGDLSYTSTEDKGRGMPNKSNNSGYSEDSAYYSDNFDDYEDEEYEYDGESGGNDYYSEDEYEEYDTESEDYVDDEEFEEYDTESEDYVDEDEYEEYDTESEDYVDEDEYEEYDTESEDYVDDDEYEEYDTDSEDYVDDDEYEEYDEYSEEDEYEEDEYYDASEDFDEGYSNNSPAGGGGSGSVTTPKSPQMSVSGTPKKDLDSDNKLADMLSIRVNQGVNKLFAKFKTRS